MERYVVREKRYEEPQGNQMISYSAIISENIPPNNIYGNLESNSIDNYKRTQYRSTYQQPHTQLQQNQARVVSGIDQRYLSSYADHSAPLIVFGQQMPREDFNADAFGNYQSRMFVGPTRNETKVSPQGIPYGLKPAQPAAPEHPIVTLKNPMESQPKQQRTSFATKKEVDFLKNEEQSQVKTHSEKLKELYKIGTKVFSGPVEKILKWNKVVQEIGAMVLYEVVGKCVSVRPEHPCTKNLVVRDENGPAMQVVYLELEFLLPEFAVPCMIRVIGRMMPGTCRLQAFSVRAASGDDVATLPRRAAVAAHHVAKLCKDYGHH